MIISGLKANTVEPHLIDTSMQWTLCDNGLFSQVRIPLCHFNVIPCNEHLKITNSWTQSQPRVPVSVFR